LSRRRHTTSVSAFLLTRSSDLTTLPTAYDVYPLDGRHDGGYYTVLDGIITTIMATIQRINIIGSREASRNRRRLKANQTGKKFKIGRTSCRRKNRIIVKTIRRA